MSWKPCRSVPSSDAEALERALKNRARQPQPGGLELLATVRGHSHQACDPVRLYTISRRRLPPGGAISLHKPSREPVYGAVPGPGQGNAEISQKPPEGERRLSLTQPVEVKHGDPRSVQQELRWREVPMRQGQALRRHPAGNLAEGLGDRRQPLRNGRLILADHADGLLGPV